MPDFLGTSLFVAFAGDHVDTNLQQEALANDPTGVRRMAQAVDRGNQLWAQWAVNSGGTIISIGGSDGRVEVPASKLGDLPSLQTQYQGAVGATCSVGVGTELSEADKALKYACMHGGARVCFYTDDVGEELADIEREKQHEGDGEITRIANEYLGKGDLLAFPRGRVTPGQDQGQAATVLRPTGEKVLWYQQMTGAGRTRAADRTARVQDTLSNIHHAMAADPGFAAAARQREVQAKEQQLRMGGQRFQVGDEVRCSHAHDTGGCSFPWKGRVTGYEPNISRDNGIHHYNVAWETQPGQHSEGLHAQTELEPSGPSLGKAEAPGGAQPPHENQSQSGSQGQQALQQLGNAQAQQLDAPSAPRLPGQSPLEQRLHSHAQKQKNQDGATLAVQQQQNGRDAIRQQVVKVLQQVKAAAPLLEEAKGQNPQVYKAVLGAVQAMIAMAKQLTGGGAAPEDGGEPGDSQGPGRDVKADNSAAPTDVKKFETDLAKMAVIHDNPVKPMTVYRVQDKHGRGPYAALALDPEDARHSPTTPDARRDFSDDFHASRLIGRAGGLYGFERPEHAEEWFGREGMRKLRMQGFEVRPVQAKKVHRSMSGRQVVYEPFDKAELPMPSPGPQHHNVVLPVGATRDGKVKVRHGDGTASWVEVRSGMVMSQDGHPISARNPSGR
jgi:hypothetical protein